MKNFFTLAIFISIGIFYPFMNVNSNAQLPPSKVTGAPGETTCAQGAGCHGSTTTDATDQINLDFGGMTAYDGSSTTLTVSIDVPASDKFGFEITALDENDMMAGSFTSTDASTFLQSNMVLGNSREYISHFGSSALSTWSFDWTSPSTNVGEITFYISANAANNNSVPDSNDEILLKTFSLSSGATSTENHLLSNINIYPNPAKDMLNIAGLTNYHNLSISDWTGRLLRSEAIGSDTKELDISNLDGGTYLLTIMGDNNILTEKFVVID